MSGENLGMKCEMKECEEDATHTLSSIKNKKASPICKSHLKEFKDNSMYYLIFPDLFEVKTITRTKKEIIDTSIPENKQGRRMEVSIT